MALFSADTKHLDLPIAPALLLCNKSLWLSTPEHRFLHAPLYFQDSPATALLVGWL